MYTQKSFDQSYFVDPRIQRKTKSMRRPYRSPVYSQQLLDKSQTLEYGPVYNTLPRNVPPMTVS